ncbi:hypothetical protein OIU78_000859 [Salix suchowensis]|nr:hypothetical protein OIU78_000859 [Salix suchowensis]
MNMLQHFFLILLPREGAVLLGCVMEDGCVCRIVLEGISIHLMEI